LSSSRVLLQKYNELLSQIYFFPFRIEVFIILKKTVPFDKLDV
jgi:hypothetical protein